MMRLTLFSLAILCALSTPPPSRIPGFQVGTLGRKSKVDLFLDPHCPASKEFAQLTAQVLKVAVNEKPLSEQLTFYVHFLPLPYHQNAFLAVKVLKLIEKRAWGKFWDFLSLQFDKIPDYTSGALSKSESAVKQELIADAIKVIGSSSPDIQSVFETQEWEIEARLAFKYAAYRGVTGTPMLFINGVLVEDVPEGVEGLVQLFSKYI